MATWEDFFADVIREIPQCPKTLVLQEIKDVVRAVAEDTKIWQNEDAIEFTLPANQMYYDVSGLIPSGAEIDSIVWIKTDVLSNSDISTYFPYRLDNDNIIRFYQKNGSDMNLFARFSFKPTLDAQTIPDLFYTKCRFAIKHGVLKNLMFNFNTAWFNADGSIFHTNKYDFYVGRIKKDLLKDRTRKKITVFAPNRFSV